MGNLDLKITIIFILSISTKQVKEQRMEISVITNQFRFLHSYQRYSVEMDNLISQTTRIPNYPSRPNKRKRSAWRDLFQTYKSYFPTKKPPSSHLVVYFVYYPLQVRDCHSVVCHWDIFFFALFHPIHHTCAVKHT